MTPNRRETFVFVHRTNIDRYRRLLKTDLTAHEREFIERRLGEEEEELLEVVQRAELIDCGNLHDLNPGMHRADQSSV